MSLRTFHETFSRGNSVAITVRGVDMLKRLAIDEFMDNEDFLGHARVNAKGEPKTIQLHKSCRMLLTYNVDKSEGIVNGAFGTPFDFNRVFAEIQLDSGVLAEIARTAFDRVYGGFYVALPMDIGCAVTVAELQGQTLEHGAGVYLTPMFQEEAT